MKAEELIQAMIAAATGAAKGKWKSMRAFVEPQMSLLAAAAKQLEADLRADLAAAAALPTKARQNKAAEKAKLRASLAFDNLKLGAESVVIAAKADLKLAVQDAINAAVGVLRSALNQATGIAIF